ncbi:hypothetical protein EPUS_05530 [Endocarpon pusillum Z07020]|uniref:Uncharacterized protein n=1 Tax=Endocarpon pusillum (strain Z07020 / HMAS-L-300199) TaxID=1263415 RepID=U1HTC3_ENDPU|nr:uncharacterized protein EPUS_05530 [Endocarpon pusillum Z07020]ERF73825.1 hypothetical protein EPUS_05530 [Endocarpon pusillum Z07020]
MLLLAIFAFCLAGIVALPSGWTAGPDNYFGKPGDAKFDYVVVGGGTAGLTVAARLAEDPRLSIAVIEASDFYEKVNGNLSIVPAYGGAVSNPAVNWGFNTASQAALEAVR